MTFIIFKSRNLPTEFIHITSESDLVRILVQKVTIPYPIYNCLLMNLPINFRNHPIQRQSYNLLRMIMSVPRKISTHFFYNQLIRLQLSLNAETVSIEKHSLRHQLLILKISRIQKNLFVIKIMRALMRNNRLIDFPDLSLFIFDKQKKIQINKSPMSVKT